MPLDLSRQQYDQIIELAAQEAVAEANEIHRRMGRSIVVSREQQVVLIPAAEIFPTSLPHDEWESELDTP